MPNADPPSQPDDRDDLPLRVSTFVDEMFSQNAYVLVEPTSGEAWIVDPGFQVDAILAAMADESAVTVTRIINTHGHADHIAGNESCKKRWPSARLTVPTGETAMLTDPRLNLSAGFGFSVVSPPADETIAAGDVLQLAHHRVGVLDVSGHSPAGIALWLGEANLCITGDSLMAGSIGRTDFPGGSTTTLLTNIREQLFSLPPETRVLAGHGPQTTIGHEMQHNPFLRGDV